MLQQYLPILIFIVFGLLLGIVALSLGRLISPKHPYPDKLETYECGFAPLEEARLPFDVRYYRIAILFIIFDLETAFLFPWAVSLRQIGWQGWCAMLFFISVLVVGFIIEWRKEALEWV